MAPVNTEIKITKKQLQQEQLLSYRSKEKI